MFIERKRIIISSLVNRFKRYSKMQIQFFKLIYVKNFSLKNSGTPQQYIGRQNPFESQIDILKVPTVSPSIFREVVSPSQKVEEEFSWSLEQKALLNPALIELSPQYFPESPTDPEYERKAQEAIDK